MSLKQLTPSRYIFSIEGLIGAGKTTAINKIRTINYKCITEPIDDFRSFKYNNFSVDPLHELYTDTKFSNHVACQLHIIECLEKLYKLTDWNSSNKFIIERGYDSPQYFIQTMWDTAFISSFEKCVGMCATRCIRERTHVRAT